MTDHQGYGMPQKTGRADGRPRIGRPPSHGAWALVDALRGKQPLDPKVSRALKRFADSLARDLGEDRLEDLPLAKQILVVRASHKHAVCLRLENWALSQGQIIKSDGTIIAALGTHYLAFSNSLRLDLQALGLDRHPRDVYPDLARAIQAAEREPVPPPELEEDPDAAG